MPIDESTEPANATNRRTFLVRTAGIGALVTAGVVASPLGSMAPFAGAKEGDSSELSDADFAAFATPLEIAVVQAYQAAIEADVLKGDAASWARLFQRNHQGVVDTLTPLVDEDAGTPVADPDLTKSSSAAIAAAAAPEDILRTLAKLEETLAATHLSAVPLLAEPLTAKTVAQVLTVESQQAALLAVAAGEAVGDVTPSVAGTDDAVPLSSDTTATTTTTTAAS